MKLSIVVFLLLKLNAMAVARPPSIPQIKGGIGDGYIYPVKSTSKSYVPPLHQHHFKGGRPRTKPQVYKVIIHNQPTQKERNQEIYKIVHLPAQNGGHGGAGGNQQDMKIFKILHVKTLDGGNGAQNSWSK